MNHTLTFLTLALVTAPAWGQQASAAREHLMGLRGELGLDGFATFLPKAARTDRLGMTHVHFQQAYLGVPVFQGAVITHAVAGGQLPVTDALVRGIGLNVQPNLTAAEALAVAVGDLGAAAPFARPPAVERVVFPVRRTAPRPGLLRATNAEDFVVQVVENILAYHIHASIRGAADTRDVDWLVDAQTGRILASWNDLHTVEGTGRSQYSGTRKLSTTSTPSGFSLKDPLRGGSTVTNMGNGTSGDGTLFTNATDAWGDGLNYVEAASPAAATVQTAAVDAQYGFQITWDYFKNIFGRDGIDGHGRATSLRVHYGKAFDNAYWDDDCFCMTFGDGSAPDEGGFRNLTAPDVIGHELSHGVCAANGLGGLTYSGEAGGLNEANSDIQGTFVVHYGYNGGTGAVVPDAIPAGRTFGYLPWTVGSQLVNLPLRTMFKPSLDGRSPDEWSSTLADLDPHQASGPGNRAIYFLAQGATATGDTSTPRLPKGMKGVGNDHAARIWYRALTTYFTPGETYAGARAACVRAATDLYGSGSADTAAVRNAFAGINVGAATPAPGPAGQLLRDPGFEEGGSDWAATPGVLGAFGERAPARTGTRDAWLCGTGDHHTDTLGQKVAIPATAAGAALAFHLHVGTVETTSAKAYDLFQAQVRDASGTVLATLAKASNLDAAPGYKVFTADLSAYRGRTVEVFFTATEDGSLETSFVVDDVALAVR